jgi:Secretion system C-terminal sorting domain
MNINYPRCFSKFGIFSLFFLTNCLFSSLNPLFGQPTLPAGTLKIDNYTIELSNQPRYCFQGQGDFLENQTVNQVRYTPIVKAFDANEITVKGIADSTYCFASTVRFSVSNHQAVGCNAITPPSVSVSDSRFQLKDSVWSAKIYFDFLREEQFFTITLTDSCGNTATQRVRVVFEDNLPPRLSSGIIHGQIMRNNPTTTISTIYINHSFKENCSIKRIMIRRFGTLPTDCWKDTLQYRTEDYRLLYDTIRVQIVDVNDLVSEETFLVRLAEGYIDDIFSIGLIMNEMNTAVDNVLVESFVNNALISSSTTTASGQFANVFSRGRSPLKIVPSKTSREDYREGVSTADMWAISRHILGSQTLASAYSIIAADVDKSGSIDAVDMMLIRRFVLFMSDSLPAGSFRFVPRTYVFQQPHDPLNEAFPENFTINNPMFYFGRFDFTAIKIGDVNHSYRNVTARSTGTLTLTTDDRTVEKGKTYTINVEAENLDVTTFQGTLACKGLIIKGFESGNWANLSEQNFGQFKNALTMAWNGNFTEGGKNLVKLTVEATESGRLSQMLSFGSTLTPAEALTDKGEGRTIVLKFKGHTQSPSDALIVYQNVPNPVSSNTRIGFHLPSESTVNLRIFNSTGQLILHKNGVFSAGENAFFVEKSELSTGVLCYQIEALGQKIVKKMVIGM